MTTTQTALKEQHENPFTPREQEIVQLAAGGKTALEIGIILGIGQRTVADHLRNAKEKVGVFKETALIASAIRGGWIS